MKVKSGSVKSFESEEFSKWLEESEKAKAEYVEAIKDLEAKGNSKEAQKLTKEYEEFCSRVSKTWNEAWKFQSALREDKTLSDDEKREVFKNWWNQGGKPVEKSSAETTSKELE